MRLTEEQYATLTDKRKVNGREAIRRMQRGENVTLDLETGEMFTESAIAARTEAQVKPESVKAGQGKAKRTAKPKPLTARFVERVAQPGEIVFVLPLPPKKLSPNGRGLYWMAKAKAIKSYRNACTALMRNAKQEPFAGRVAIDLEFYLCRVFNDTKSYYPNDEDNARGSVKAAQDALKDAGIIAGDGQKFVRVGKTTLYTRAKEHQGFTCVVMTLRKDESE